MVVRSTRGRHVDDEHTHRTANPGLEHVIAGIWNHLDRNVLITSKRGSDGASVCKLDLVEGSGWEHPLEEGDAGIEDGCSFSAGLCMDVNLTGWNRVCRVEGHVFDVQRRRRVEVDGSEVGTQLEGLDL